MTQPGGFSSTASRTAVAPVPSRSGAACQFCRLRAELDEALERTAQLEAMLWPTPKIIWPTLKLSRSEMIVLEGIYTLRHPASHDVLVDRLEFGLRREVDKEALDVVICRLRKKLARAAPGLHITSLWGYGYTIDEIARTRLSGLREMA